MSTWTAQPLFQSRYRAASHFRANLSIKDENKLKVSISLSSGFSFQVLIFLSRLGRARKSFQSRYRAASHFRDKSRSGTKPCFCSFNLVIERLLISGIDVDSEVGNLLDLVSISLSSGFSFQEPTSPDMRGQRFLVSISLSSGFSFQGLSAPHETRLMLLFQSRYRAASHFRSPRHRFQCAPQLRFNLVIERLLISGLVDGVAGDGI